YRKGVLWSPSYFAASCGGAPISIIRQYIERQRNPQSDSYRRQRASAPSSGVKPQSLLR
ncbi:MAG TPA: transposase, partial [Xanthobacteraceae bacterium]|nr:transposase [Xanthobacteraceae bacterium]